MGVTLFSPTHTAHLRPSSKYIPSAWLGHGGCSRRISRRVNNMHCNINIRRCCMTNGGSSRPLPSSGGAYPPSFVKDIRHSTFHSNASSNTNFGSSRCIPNSISSHSKLEWSVETQKLRFEKACDRVCEDIANPQMVLDSQQDDVFVSSQSVCRPDDAISSNVFPEKSCSVLLGISKSSKNMQDGRLMFNTAKTLGECSTMEDQYRDTVDSRRTNIDLPEFSASSGSVSNVDVLRDTSTKDKWFGESRRRMPSVDKHILENNGVRSNGVAERTIEQSFQKPCVKKSPRKDVTPPISPQKKLLDIYDKVLVVDKVSAAKDIVQMLTTKYKDLTHACDTEVSKIDVKQETPVDHGEIICFSIYSGPTVDFGNGRSCIWVDVLDGERDILMVFAPFFENASIKKVWHNYSFDRHVIANYGIKISGFYADTMHLARLWNSSRRINGGYSLEALTGDPEVMLDKSPKRLPRDGNMLEKNFTRAQSGDNNDFTVGKISMKEIFGKKKVKKDGSDGKLVTIAPVEILQREERIPWICYSALDSISTLKLFESLKKKLMDMTWTLDGEKTHKGNMLDFYEEYWRPFGNLLVEMEAAGMLVNREHLSDIEKVAVAEQQAAADKFRNWASRYCPDAEYMNVGSDTQIRQLFFGGTPNMKNSDIFLPEEKTFKVPNTDNFIEEGKKSPSKFRNITLAKIADKMVAEIYTASGWPSVGGDALKFFAGKVSANEVYLPDDPFDDSEFFSSPDATFGEETETITSKIKQKDTSAYGTAYAAFGGGKKGIDACHAIAALCEICSIDSLISNFILPLQGNRISGKDGRIHCSLNINTETGRLSARRPNLQNPPALEKDRYKIREAFVAAPGNSLIVADYGQLELRILAHLANCKSMLDAFKAGGDFHSRTAMNMYDYIRESVEKGKVILEWHAQPGEEKPPVPLLKETFASERRKAKMLNFSIAYGKTPVGLSKDWKVSVKEAKETVELWYKERQEVLRWQVEQKKKALKEQRVHTLLGRARNFPSGASCSNAQKGHIERAAINAPVQGSAADVAMCAMLEIARNDRLKELNWKLLLQVHDEVILEGPSESAEEAKAIVVDCMSKPFNGHNFLKVDLAVDAKCAHSWYAAK